MARNIFMFLAALTGLSVVAAISATAWNVDRSLDGPPIREACAIGGAANAFVRSQYDQQRLSLAMAQRFRANRGKRTLLDAIRTLAEREWMTHFWHERQVERFCNDTYVGGELYGTDRLIEDRLDIPDYQLSDCETVIAARMMDSGSYDLDRLHEAYDCPARP